MSNKNKAKEYFSDIIEEIKSRTSLETILRVHLEMKDYIHWNNGEYSGNINEELEYLLKRIEEWQNYGAPLRNNKKQNN
jgi:hypothetical protein